MTENEKPTHASSLSDSEVNSRDYWRGRFDSDWQDLGGPEQTIFFYRLALELFPEWLDTAIRGDKLTILDWGCATGEGSEYLAKTLDAPVTGVDFAENAIEAARKNYSHANFLAVDLTRESIDQRFDILFCSNTLEHFPEPWVVLENIAHYSCKLLVILVPFNEFERHSEHEVTFEASMIPARLGNRFQLVASTAVDTGQREPSYWPGQQIFLIYATSETIEHYNLTLEDMLIRTNVETQKSPTANGYSAHDIQQVLAPLHSKVSRLIDSVARGQAELRSQVSRLEERIVQEGAVQAELTLERQNARRIEIDLSKQNASLRAENDNLQFTLATKDNEIKSLLGSRSWKITQGLRSANSARRSGLSNLERKLGGPARSLYRALPLPLWIKQKLRDTLLTRAAANQTYAESALPASHSGVILPKADKPDVLVWAVIDWHFRIQRPQHLAKALSRAGHRTFYISNHFEDAPEPGFRVEKLSSDSTLYNVYLSVPGAPAIYFGMPTVDTERAIFQSLALFLQWIQPQSIHSVVQHPFWKSFAERMPNRKLVYDMMDHHEGFGNNAADITAAEHALLREANSVITTSTFLENIARKSNNNVFMVRNACDYEHFATPPADFFSDPLNRKIIGYYGAIAEWFDIDLVKRIAEERPSDLILLVGNDTVDAAKQLERYSNVIMVGEVKYSELPFYAYSFDVCILPFKIMPLTLATNPVKVYEYLAVGKPVVSVDLPEIGQFGGLVIAATSHDDFMSELDRTLKEENGEMAVAKRRDFAARQTWGHRAGEFGNAMAHTQMPRASIIVVTFNNLEFTKACLFSLDHSAYDDMEIIVVDNASTDGTQDFLTAWRDGHDNRVVILNDDNLGFAAGNNIGLERATGKYLVLLNNDTYVTPGWLGTLLGHLQRDLTLGLVGPVTNNIGNEAKIPIQYHSMDEMIAKALQFTSTRLGTLQKSANVAFFCVAFTRETYELIGDLDEEFKVGFFEDDDYCRRVEKEGLAVAIADDVFVHHHLSASFDALSAKRKQELFEANKATYERKWGTWVPHQHRDSF